MQPPSARERLVYTLFHTGLRTGEVLGLRWGAVDLRAGTLTVRISRSRGEDNPPTAPTYSVAGVTGSIDSLKTRPTPLSVRVTGRFDATEVQVAPPSVLLYGRRRPSPRTGASASLR
jgi:hypothetical protein